MIGVLYYDVFDDYARADEYLSRVLDLVKGMKGNLHSYDWYKLTIKYKQTIRDKFIQKEREEDLQKKKQYLKKLKVVIDHMADLSNLTALTEYVLDKHPPKHISNADVAALKENVLTLLKSGTKTDKRKVVLKLNARYHPDKVDASVHGMKWKVLCEEITKNVNRLYETNVKDIH